MSDNGRSREIQNQLPDPLQSGGPGTWAPPAAALSLASASVGLLVLWFLQRNADLRGLFKIALVDSFVINRAIVIGLSLFATSLAWAIVFHCRRRPGPVLPRWWAFVLALLTSVVAVMQCLTPAPEWASLLDAAEAAGFAATLALSPRLLRLHPDTPWVQRVAPCSLLLVSLVTLPTLYVIGGDVVEVWKRGLDDAINLLHTQTENLMRCGEAVGGCSNQEYLSAFDGLSTAVANLSFRDIPVRFHHDENLVKRHTELVEAEEALLGGLAAELPRRLGRHLAASLEGSLDSASTTNTPGDFKALWAVALKLGKPEQAKQAYGALLDMLIASTPPLLREAPVVYTSFASDGPWDKNLAFDTASRQVIAHYMRMKSLFTELGGIADNDGDPALQQLKLEFRQKYHDGWDRRLLSMKDSWAEHWLLPYLEEQALDAKSPLPWLQLSKVLHMPVIGNIKANDIHSLLDLSRQEAEKSLDGQRASNCEKKQRDAKIFSLDCRAYATTAKEKTALQVEFRLIYDLKQSDKPDRIFFFLPIPPGTNLESFAFDVENALPKGRPALQQLLKAIDTQRGTQVGGKLQIPPQCPPKSGASACAEAWEYAKDSGQQYIKLVIYRD